MRATKWAPLIGAAMVLAACGGDKPAPTKEEVLALKGDPVNGKAIISMCFTCHKVGRQGVDFGPELTQFGKTQPPEVIVAAVVLVDNHVRYEGGRRTSLWSAKSPMI